MSNIEDCGCGVGPARRNNPPVQICNANRVLRTRIPIRKLSAGQNTILDKTNSVELIGRSWAADCTAFCIPEFDIGLDAGYIVHGKRFSNYFVTHTHTDHCHFLTHLKSRSKPPKIFLPASSVANATKFIGVAQQLTSNITETEYNESAWTKDHEFVGVTHGDQVVVGNPNRGLICNVVNMDHGVPCVGYCFSKRKQSLKAKYGGLSGREIGALRKQGIQVTEEEIQPTFAFLGDTTAKIFEGSESSEESIDILNFPTIIVECSFLGDDEAEKASNSKHVLWSDLKPHIETHPDTTFVLIHFSHRYTTTQVADFFQIEENYLPNVIPWIPDHGLMSCLEGAEPSSMMYCEEVWSHY